MKINTNLQIQYVVVVLYHRFDSLRIKLKNSQTISHMKPTLRQQILCLLWFARRQRFRKKLRKELFSAVRNYMFHIITEIHQNRNRYGLPKPARMTRGCDRTSQTSETYTYNREHSVQKKNQYFHSCEIHHFEIHKCCHLSFRHAWICQWHNFRQTIPLKRPIQITPVREILSTDTNHKFMFLQFHPKKNFVPPHPEYKKSSVN